jgi:hypothetical protein
MSSVELGKPRLFLIVQFFNQTFKASSIEIFFFFLLASLMQRISDPGGGSDEI